MRSKFLVALLFGCAVSSSLWAASYTSVANGDWNNPATWGAASFPVAGDDVTIADGTIVSINVSSACLSIIFSGTGTIDFPINGVSLSVSGDVTMNGTSHVTGTGNARIFTIGGNFHVPGSQTGTVGGIQFNVVGTTTVTGYFQFTSSSVGLKTFNGLISVTAGGTWDNFVGENVIVNCSIFNNGNWPAPIAGTGIYQITTNSASYTYTGLRPINMTELRVNNATGTVITNLGILILSRTGGSALNVGVGRSFVNGDGTVAAALFMNGTGGITNTGTLDFTKTNNTVDYIFAGSQNVFNTTYYNLRCSNSGTKTLVGTTTVTNEVNISGSVLVDAQTNTLQGAANLVMTGTSELRISKVSTVLPQLTGTANSLASGTTMTFNGAGVQTLKASSATNPSTTNSYPYQHVKISGNNGLSNVNFAGVSLISGDLSLSNLGRINNNPVMTVVGTVNFATTATTVLTNNVTVGNIIFSAGTLNYSNRTITINGDNGSWTNNGGVAFINASSLVIFTIGTNQTIAGTTNTTFTSLTIDNANNITMNGVDAQVTGTLTFTAGNIITGTRNINIPLGGTIARTSGHVEGNLQKDVPTGTPSMIFELGTGTTYTPLNLDFTGVTVTGSMMCAANVPDHPDINGSNIEPLRSANRWWSITNSGTAFTSYDATFNFVAADVDPLAATASFRVKRSDGTIWHNTTAGIRTATSTQFVAEPSANLPDMLRQDFQCGELISTTGVENRVTGSVNWSDPATWIQHKSGTATLSSGNPTITGTGTDFAAELIVGDVIMLQTSPGVTYTVSAINSSSSVDVSPAPAISVSGGYGRQYVPMSIIDSVIVGNSNIVPDAATDVNFDMPGATLINSLTINTSAVPRSTPQSVTHSVMSPLTVQTNLIINQPGAPGTDNWNLNAGTATINGSLIIGSAVDDNTLISQAIVTTGTIDVGNLVFNTATTPGNEVSTILDMSGGAGRINVGGQLTFASDMGLLIPGTTSTFNYRRSASSQRINWPATNLSATKWTYNHLLLNNTSTSGAFVQAGDDISVATDGTINVAGDLIVETGLLEITDNTDIDGSPTAKFQVAGGATFTMIGNLSTFPTGFGTFDLGIVAPFGTVKYDQTNPVTIAAPPLGFGNLKVLNTGSIVDLPAGTTTIAGSLTVGSGTSTPNLQADASGSVLTVVNNVTINAGATISAAASGRITDFNIGGNWVNNGTFSPSTTSADAGVVFTGAGTVQPQTIGGTSADTFYNLQINTAATTHLVTLLKNISVSNVASFTQGGLDLSDKVLSVTTKSTTSMVRTGGYVKSETSAFPYGRIRWTVGNTTGAFVYPFGRSSTEYIPFTINITGAGAPANGPTMSVATYTTAANNTPYPATVVNLNGTSGGVSVADRFWIVSELGFSTKPTAAMTFTAVGGNGAVPPSERPASVADLSTIATSPAGIAAQRWNPAGYWDDALPNQTFANNAPAVGFFQVTVPNVVNYSPWAVAEITAPLPIRLLEFRAKQTLDIVEINWKTGAEIDNDFFTVQRSVSGSEFEDVIKVKGAGTKSTETTYHALDEIPYLGRSYYRLKQTDFDGQSTYSKIVAVDVIQSASWTLHPNPSSGNTFDIRFSSGDIGKDVFIKVQDIGGREVLQVNLSQIDGRDITIEIPQQLSPGMYLVTLAAAGEIVRQKLVVK